MTHITISATTLDYMEPHLQSCFPKSLHSYRDCGTCWPVHSRYRHDGGQ
jgi:hypothetical protein